MFLPIFIMTRNEAIYLNTCIASLTEIIPAEINYHIYIIDNDSNQKEQMEVLKNLNLKYNNITILLTKNRWVRSINIALEEARKLHEFDIFFLSDGDIWFNHPSLSKEIFFNTYQNILNNKFIGKIGFSLDWQFLEMNNLEEILEQEKKLYSENNKINDLYIAPVDTTACFMRNKWSIEESAKFFPDHMRYLKYDLYSCRTPRDLLVYHKGWECYVSNPEVDNEVDMKVLCFTLNGADVKKTILNRASFKIYIFYKIFSRPIRYLWILRRCFYCTKYLVRNFRGAQSQGYNIKS